MTAMLDCLPLESRFVDEDRPGDGFDGGWFLAIRKCFVGDDSIAAVEMVNRKIKRIEAGRNNLGGRDGDAGFRFVDEED